MKKYWAIVKSTWQEYLTYRFNFFLEVIGGIISMLVIIALWYVIYKEKGQVEINGYSLAEMITYLLLAGLIHSFLWLTAQGDEINDDINQGRLSNFLVKPLNPAFYWLCRDFCRRIMTLTLGLIEFAIIFFLFKNFLIGPASFFHLFLFFLAIILGGFLHFIIFFLFSIIAFWMDQTWGPRFIIRVIMEIATGVIIPLSFFPGFWKTIFDFLPFKYMIYFPLQIYLDKILLYDLVREFFILLIWLIFFGSICWFVWKKGIKQYAAYGA